MSALVEAGLAAKTGLATLAVIGLQGTLLALAALVLVRGGRLRPSWQAAVWLVVLVKFVLPWGPAMPWSLADLVETLRGGGEAAAAPLVLKTAAAPAVVDAVPAAPSIAWLVLAAVWLAGSVVVCARAFAAYRGALAGARAAAEAPVEARELLARLAAGVRVRVPRLVVGDALIGPHVVGALRPVIVVPPALLEEPALLRPALLHELAHVRRRDALGRFIQVLARAAFWFFPVVYLASKRLELAREAACDAWALEAGDISRPAYARLLVQMAQLRTAAAPALAAPRTLDARVSAVLGPPARPRLGWLHGVALAAWIALALGGARTASARTEGAVCIYTPEVAEALRQAHPDADADGDGFLSREEACDYQAALRKRVSEGELVPMLDETSTELLVEPLCCNCDVNEGLSPSASTGAAGASCHRVEEGVDR